MTDVEPSIADAARAVADAVLWEGYLLYPYRASAAKNAVRWQFGILGPPGTPSELGEPAELHSEFLLRRAAPNPGVPAGGAGAQLTVWVRLLQLQRRTVERAGPDGFEPVGEIRVGSERFLGWDEALPHEIRLGPFPPEPHRAVAVGVPGGEDVELLRDEGGAVVGRLVRRRRALTGELLLTVDDLGSGLARVGLTVGNTGPAASGRDDATARSFLGAHLLVGVSRGSFVSLLEPPADALAAAAACDNHRCWPVLAAETDDLVLVSPIILYDYPEVAPESAGDLYDATEIDEILTLRVMTMTDEEKSEARATDPRAAAIIDRCDALAPEQLEGLHGRLRDPHSEPLDVPSWSDGSGRGSGGGLPWWDPGVDAAVDPETDTVVVDGVPLSRGSRVRVHPRRRADAQDLFFAGRQATVAAVYADVDGNDHVAVVLTDDPAADLHDWYGRYLYFAPDELEPAQGSGTPTPGTHPTRKEG